jgi:hypothetical protein
MVISISCYSGIYVKAMGQLIATTRLRQHTQWQRSLAMQNLISIGILLVVAWVVGFLVFKVAGFLIHLLVIIGIIMLVVGFFRRVGGDSSLDR